ncbi:MAG: DedA family protein [Dysgonamonadaceae bacterium]|jgi:membrane-associated protein|nr:DedA family protein [Dysgonamonadaceae bacterium]
MEFIQLIIEFLTDTEAVLDLWVNNYGLWIYAILFAVIFTETGLVVMPFLPGDSLLFIVGTIAHRSTNELSVWILLVLLISAALLGDNCNYSIGRYFGQQLFSNPDSKIFKQKYLKKTHQFYEKHGGKTIIIARFVPIVRTFAPFVAGMGKMKWKRFFSFSIVGGISWITIFLFLGYFVGGFPFVQNNLKLIALLIIFASIMPAVFEVIRNKYKKEK